eukprot:scaffold10991_cov35-Phaeocystis_antarctica.AAC.3
MPPGCRRRTIDLQPLLGAARARLRRQAALAGRSCAARPRATKYWCEADSSATSFKGPMCENITRAPAAQYYGCQYYTRNDHVTRIKPEGNPRVRSARRASRPQSRRSGAGVPARTLRKESKGESG